MISNWGEIGISAVMGITGMGILDSTFFSYRYPNYSVASVLDDYDDDDDYDII